MDNAERPRDEGTSLVEVVVALGITATVLLALLSSAVFALSSTVEARQEQQAADYLNEVLEQARTAEYASLTMLTSQVAGAQGVVVAGGVSRYDAGSGLEAVAASTTGVVVPQVETRTTSNGVFTLRRYVTVPVTATFDVLGQPSVRRVTAVVSWTAKGKPRVRRSSTLVTMTRRGLPLPAFTWAYHGPAPVVAGLPEFTKNPENTVGYGFLLQNQGARDTWALSASSGSWAWYRDTDKDGLWSGDAGEPPLAASTGPVEPGSEPVHVVAVRTIGVAESGASTTTFTATPASDPSAAKSVQVRLVVQTGAVTPPSATPGPSASPSPSASATPAACNAGSSTGVTSTGTVPTATTQNSYTTRALRLSKTGTGTPGDSAAVAWAPMVASDTVLEPALCNWSTDLHTTAAGRRLEAATTPATLASRAEWRFQPGSSDQNDFRGEPVLELWVQCPSGTPALTVSLLSRSGSTETPRTSAALATPGCSATTFTRYAVQLSSMPTFGIATTDSLVLRVTASAPVRLGYATSGAPATFTIGMK